MHVHRSRPLRKHRYRTGARHCYFRRPRHLQELIRVLWCSRPYIRVGNYLFGRSASYGAIRWISFQFSSTKSAIFWVKPDRVSIRVGRWWAYKWLHSTLEWIFVDRVGRTTRVFASGKVCCDHITGEKSSYCNLSHFSIIEYNLHIYILI